ncbi:MAG TPA: DUF2220 family protein [Arachnia sp.]|nr:DUF2220 family protein [Arachnia sp.]HMT87754.1 DUF2220 family protein [Arachnia sp.]
MARRAAPAWSTPSDVAARVRLRLGAGIAPVAGVTEVAVRPAEAAALGLAPSRVMVVENEITYLSVPVRSTRWWPGGADIAST